MSAHVTLQQSLDVDRIVVEAEHTPINVTVNASSKALFSATMAPMTIHANLTNDPSTNTTTSVFLMGLDGYVLPTLPA